MKQDRKTRSALITVLIKTNKIKNISKIQNKFSRLIMRVKLLRLLQSTSRPILAKCSDVYDTRTKKDRKKKDRMPARRMLLKQFVFCAL